MDADTFGQSIVSIAQGFDGACACPAHKQSIFDAVGFVFDTTPFHVDANGVHGISTCYVFARQVLTLAGVALYPWRPGQPIGALIEWAKVNGCWQAAGDGLTPSSGDVMIIGAQGGKHVAVVSDCDGETLSSIDGGQVCRRKQDGHDGLGRQMIASRSRKWQGTTVVGTQTDTVVGWAVCALMPIKIA